jgi:four helix bundle protein
MGGTNEPRRVTYQDASLFVADVLGKQVLRSATSVGANYRAACRAQSGAMFIARLSIVVEEAEQILKIMASSRKTEKH